MINKTIREKKAAELVQLEAKVRAYYFRRNMNFIVLMVTSLISPVIIYVVSDYIFLSIRTIRLLLFMAAFISIGYAEMIFFDRLNTKKTIRSYYWAVKSRLRRRGKKDELQYITRWPDEVLVLRSVKINLFLIMFISSILLIGTLFGLIFFWGYLKP